MAKARPQFSESDSWVNIYDGCEAIGQKIMEHISLRNQQQRNSKVYTQENSEARHLMKRFIEGKELLTEKLITSRELLTAGEYERRERLMDRLSTRKLQIDAAFNQSEVMENRDMLLGGQTGQPSVNIWGVEDDGAVRDTQEMTYEDLMQQKQLAIQEQDKGLDQLHNVVVQQRMMAQNIGQELDLHNEIIDDITDHTDRTRERLLRETRHVKIVSRKSDTCGYWVLIVILLIAIIAVACVPSKH